MLAAIFEPFVIKSPLTVMAAAAIGRLLNAERLDALFERARQGQYTHQLLFSTVFSLMGAVVIGTKKSIHHAYQTAEDPVDASVVAVYDKLQHVETCTAQAVVRDMAAEVVPLIDRMNGALPPLAPGYTVKVLDGNCIQATEHRLKVLRGIAAGALPGKTLVVLEEQRRLLVDVFPCEDGHAQERALLGEVLPTVAAGELWIDDRNFCTFLFLWGIATRGAYFITRQHGGMACQVLGPRRGLGEGGTGMVYEEPVVVRGEQGQELRLRRVVVELEQATRDGDKALYLLTNLPKSGPKAVCGTRVASLYGERWTIEAAFLELTRHFHSEINTLGYPKAALFAFCVALVAFNAVSLMKAALRGCHGAERVEKDVSNYYIAAEVESTATGMLIAVPPEHWRVFAEMTAAQFVATMLMLAGKVQLRKYQKHPRGPKKPRAKPTYDPKHPHVSTARLLALRTTHKRKAT